jgi:hypothetical protein
VSRGVGGRAVRDAPQPGPCCRCLLIDRTELDRAVALVRRSGVHTDLELRLRPDGAGGRPRQLLIEVFLAGVILAASHEKSLALTNDASRCLTVRQVRYLLEEAIEPSSRTPKAAFPSSMR